MARLFLFVFVLALTLTPALSHVLRTPARKSSLPIPPKSISAPEPHLNNIQQITTGGTNAEAYWSFDNTKLSFQAIRDPLGQTHACDQIYTMNVDGSDIKLLSTGRGRDTCSFYYPDNIHVVYSSTQASDTYCPPIPDMNYGYLWPVYKTMEIFRLNTQTGELVQLTNNSAYDAETTISPKGDLMVYTSDISGDLELYIMPVNGSGPARRMTYNPGYDGGAVFSYSGKMLAWRAGRPRGQDLTNYLNLLEAGLVEPLDMQLFIMTDINDPNSVIQLTNNTAVNFAPYFLPDDSGLIFSADLESPGMFNLYTIKLDGTGLTQVTQNGNFNSFPMFSFNGKYLAFESDRNAKAQGQIDVYIAEWSA
jgi:TolB protein